MHRYFISFSYSRGFGNSEVLYPKEIEGIDDIKAIARLIEHDSGYVTNELVILNYIKFQ